MQAVTLTVAVLASLLVVALKPRQGLGVYIALLFFYPSYLAADIGTVNITAGRIVVTVLLVRVFAEPALMRTFRRRAVDYFVLGLFLWGTFTLLMTEGVEVLENRAGAFMDMVFPYFAARLVIREKADFVAVGKWAAVTAAGAALLGALEAVQGLRPYEPLRQYSFIPSRGGTSDMRWGLFRAAGAAGNTIVWGMSFVALMPWVMMLRKEPGQLGLLGWTGTAAATAGVFSSMSSGPLLCVVAFAACAVLSRKPSLVKPLLIVLLLAVVAAEIYSQTHFYYIIGRFTFSDKTSWYRARLLDVAVEKLPEYWGLGYGNVDPPGWGSLIDGRRYTDLCNEYILLAVRFGVLGTALFIGTVAASVTSVKRAYQAARSRFVRDSSWFVASAVLAYAVAVNSVGLLSTAAVLFYLTAGASAAPLFDDRRIRAQEGASAWPTS